MRVIRTIFEKDIRHSRGSLLVGRLIYCQDMNNLLRKQVDIDDLILRVEDLKKYFPSQSMGFGQAKAVVHAVDGVSFQLKRGEVLGIVGESGCGKSTLARVILRLIEPTSGNIFLEEENVTKLSRKSLVALRKNMQLIFQDPYNSLNPKLPVRYLVGEGLRVHGICNRKEIEDRVIKVLKSVGIKAEHVNRYPHEFSGGRMLTHGAQAEKAQMTWYEGSRIWYIGRLNFSIYTLAGAWVSLGLHVSNRPFQIIVHFLWFTISVMSREEGKLLEQTELSNAEV